ncbi:MAG: FecCD family ABC transporter permease [Candidatus Bathyarchaeia archaeon]|jgi:iron complex transport system permease protein
MQAKTETIKTRRKHVSKILNLLKALRGLPVAAILLILLVSLAVLSLGLGVYHISAGDVVDILVSNILGHAQDTIPNHVIMTVRLPRISAAILVGAALSLAGGSFQGLFRNPLVSPDILGVSAGAGFGAALAILLSGDRLMIQVSAFTFAIIAVIIVYSVSKVVKGNRTLSLVLAGLAISSFFNASLALMEYIADPTNQLPMIIYWLMGSLASLTMPDVLFAAIPLLTGAVIILLIRWRFNVLAMGEEEAQALGVNVGRLRIIIVVCCTLMSASAVCLSGIIGWVGLVIPHISRLLVGPDHKRLLPVCLLLGACYLLLIDDIARTASSLEIPLGILTAMIGAPFFLYMLSRRGKGWA